MEDLISFEDLVVQPYNSYFNLEKELHEVKAKLSLMEKRLKYLEDKIGYGCKGNLTLEEKIDALDIKYEELDDEIVMVEESVQKDIKGICDKVKTLEDIFKLSEVKEISLEERLKYLEDMFKSIINYISVSEKLRGTSCELGGKVYNQPILSSGIIDIKQMKELNILKDYCVSNRLWLRFV